MALAEAAHGGDDIDAVADDLVHRPLELARRDRGVDERLEVPRILPPAPDFVDLAHARILIADDDAAFRNRIARALELRGFIVTAVGSVAEALAQTARPPAFAVLDLRLGDGNGLELVQPLRQARPDIRIVVLTGYAGQISLGHAGLLAAGAFTTGILFKETGASFWITLPASAAVGALKEVSDRELLFSDFFLHVVVWLDG